MESVERIRMTRARGARRPSRQAGVTFIELMAVVLIIAILGLIAVPSYRQYGFARTAPKVKPRCSGSRRTRSVSTYRITATPTPWMRA